MAPVWIRTERLWLRPFAPGDVDRLHEVFSLPEVRRYLLDGNVMPRSWVEEVVATSEAGFAARGYGLWCVTNAPDAPAMGFTGYREFHDPPVCELLYGLDPQHWGLGWAREASQAALRYGFEALGFDPIRASIDAPNEASLALARRLGFRETSRGPGPAFEQVHFAIERAEFAAPAGRFEVEAGAGSRAGRG